MIWLYAACAVLVYAAFVSLAIRPAAAPRVTVMPPGSHLMPTSLGVVSAMAGACGAFCALFIAQVASAPLDIRRAPLTEDPAAPLAGILEPSEAAALTSYLRTPAPQTPVPASMSSLPDVDTMISRLEARLETTPTDAKGWKTLAWAYQATGRDDLARATYEKGLSFNPDDQDLKSAAGAGKSEARSN